VDRVNQRSENIATLATFVKKAGVRSDLERGTLEAEIIFVHDLFLDL